MQQNLETCLWCCHSVIPFWCQMSSCWQIRGAVDSIALFQYHAHTIWKKDPTIQPVTKNFLGTMALRYSGVPSKSCKQAMAVGKWTIKASRISIWLAECSQSSCRHLKTTAKRLLILPATQANVTRHAGLEIKKSSGCLLTNNWRNIVARCKFLVSSFYNVNDAAQGL